MKRLTIVIGFYFFYDFYEIRDKIRDFVKRMKTEYCEKRRVDTPYGRDSTEQNVLPVRQQIATVDRK